jgi:hypothetical protein
MGEYNIQIFLDDPSREGAMWTLLSGFDTMPEAEAAFLMAERLFEDLIGEAASIHLVHEPANGTGAEIRSRKVNQ